MRRAAACRPPAPLMRHRFFWSATAPSLPACHRDPHMIMTGVNINSSFKAALLRCAPGCEVWGYDYSVANVRVSCPFFNQEPSLTCSFHQWGPEIKYDPELRGHAHFQRWALGAIDDHEESSSPKYWTLDSLMKHNGTLQFHFFSLPQSSISSQLRHSLSSSISGHSFIDILKIDIEGAEFDALMAFINEHAHGDLPIGQLQVELHAWGNYGLSKPFFKWCESVVVTAVGVGNEGHIVAAGAVAVAVVAQCAVLGVGGCCHLDRARACCCCC